MHYRPEQYWGRITCFLGNEHYDSGHDRDLRLGWSKVVDEELETYRVPGVEALMFQEPNVASVADELRSCLARAQVPTHQELARGAPL